MPMFQAVLYGKKLIVITEEEKALSSLLAKRMSKEAAFCIMTTPSIIQNYLFNEQFRNAMKNCRLLVTAGEKLNQRLADRITGLYPDSLVFLNLLGCTECGFGFAIETIRPGEIHIRGVRVSSGYVSASDEDKARFFLEDGLYCYKSGDLGYQDDMGRLIHCGRNNKMVKLHGSRVDLNEVEKRMEECPGIRNAAVKVFTRNDEDYACAFYAADKPVDEQEIREQLLKNLTRAMIPTLFVWMEKLPANDRGKTDYSALKEPERAVRTVEARESIVYDDERLNIICRGVEEILGFKDVRKEDNFLSLGGDSLGGMTFISYLYDNGYRLTLKELYAAPTIEKMVDFLKPVEENADDVVDNGTINEMDEAKYPAEENEMFYYFLSETFRETLNYWIRYQFTLKKNWSETDFRSVIDRLYKAHPVLRSEFRTEEGVLWHYILKDQEPDIDYKDISSMSAEEQEKVCATCWNEINSRKDSLCSFVCLKTDADKCVVLMRISHAIADGISVLNIISGSLLAEGTKFGVIRPNSIRIGSGVYRVEFIGGSNALYASEMDIDPALAVISPPGCYHSGSIYVHADGYTAVQDVVIQSKSIMIGDANGDGKVNVCDVTAIQRHVAEVELLTGACLFNADVNGDGEVTIDDATHLLRYLAEFDGIVLGKQPTA